MTPRYVLKSGLLLLIGSSAQAQLWSADQVPDWRTQRAPEGASIEDMHCVGDRLVAGARGAIVGSADGGVSWTTLGAPGNGSDVYFDVIEGDGRWFVASRGVRAGLTNNALFRSDDDGASWIELPAGQALGPVIRNGLDYGASRLFAIVGDSPNQAQGMVWSSDNAGFSWIVRPTPIQVTDIAVRGEIVIATPTAIDNDELFGSILRSDDGGESWSPIDLVSQGFQRGIVGLFEMEATSSGFFGIISSFGEGGVARSDASGRFWERADDGITRIPLALDEHNGEIYLLERDRDTWLASVLKWNETAGVWEPATPSFYAESGAVSTYKLQATDSAVLVIDTGQQVVWRSTEGGAFERSETGLEHALVFASAASDEAALANPVNSGTIWYRSADSRQWRRSELPPGEGEVVLEIAAVSPHDEPGVFLVGTQTEGIFLTEDGGETWQIVNTGVPTYNGTAGLQFREIEAFARVPREKGDVWYAGTGRGIEFFGGGFFVSSGGVVRSFDRGASWQPINTGLPVVARNDFGDPVFAPILAMGVVDGVVLADVRRFGPYRLDPGSSVWRPSNTGVPNVFGTSKATGLAFETVGSSIFLATQDGRDQGMVLRSDDQGRTWFRAHTGLPLAGSARTFAARNGVLYLGIGNGIEDFFTDEAGVWRSDNLGVSWARLGEGIDTIGIRDLDFMGDTLIAGTVQHSACSLAFCRADVNGDGLLTLDDFAAFEPLFEREDRGVDFDDDGTITPDDFIVFQALFLSGCP